MTLAAPPPAPAAKPRRPAHPAKPKPKPRPPVPAPPLRRSQRARTAPPPSVPTPAPAPAPAQIGLANYPRLLAPPHLSGTPVSLSAATIAAINARYLQLCSLPVEAASNPRSAAQQRHHPNPNPNAIPPAHLQELGALCGVNLNPLGLAAALAASLNPSTPTGLRDIAATVHTGIGEWLTKPHQRGSTTTTTDRGTSVTSTTLSTHTARSTRLRSLTRQRDNSLCVITRTEKISVAHIFPFSMGSAPGACGSLRRFIHLFAGGETAGRIDAYLGLGGGGGTQKSMINRLENCITLDLALHERWAEGAVLLEPVGDPLALATLGGGVLSSYPVRLSFLPSHRRRPLVPPPLGPTGEAITPPLATEQYPLRSDPTTRKIALHQNTYSPLDDALTGTRLMAQGDIITLSTPDPVGLPLPHPDLLVLHAALSRLVRAAGAAAPEGWGGGEGGEGEEEGGVRVELGLGEMDGEGDLGGDLGEVAMERVFQYLHSLPTPRARMRAPPTLTPPMSSPLRPGLGGKRPRRGKSGSRGKGNVGRDTGNGTIAAAGDIAGTESRQHSERTRKAARTGGNITATGTAGTSQGHGGVAASGSRRQNRRVGNGKSIGK